MDNLPADSTYKRLAVRYKTLRLYRFTAYPANLTYSINYTINAETFVQEYKRRVEG